MQGAILLAVLASLGCQDDEAEANAGGRDAGERDGAADADFSGSCEPYCDCPGGSLVVPVCAMTADAGLSDAGLSDAGLSDAGLSDAGLSDAGLSDADLSDADLSDADLSDAGLSDAGPSDAGQSSPDAATDSGEVDTGRRPLTCVPAPAQPVETPLALDRNVCYEICGNIEISPTTGYGSVLEGCRREVDGSVACQWIEVCQIGRRTLGVHCATGEADGALARWWATVAALEAGSVVAFERIGRWLSGWNAPRSLVQACTRAADDERRHARQMGAFARQAGAEPVSIHVTPESEPPSLFDFALENRVEGCVRETFGAALAHHQAHRATDPAVAAAMKGIARDETRHAQLSWRIAAWVEARLGAHERAAIAAAAREAAIALAEPGTQLSHAERATAGLPEPGAHRALWTALMPLWAQDPVA